MTNTIRIKRKTTGAAGAPTSLANGELAMDEPGLTLYYGLGTGGTGGTATTAIPIAGSNAFVDKTSAQTISGIKTFSNSPVAPTPGLADNSGNVATTAFVRSFEASQRGIANGVCPLDGNSLVPSAYLPSYVDDVKEYANLAGFPTTGESDKIYVADDTAKIYRWSGSTYIEISPSPGSTDAVPEGPTNQYFTQARVLSTVLSGLSAASAVVLTASDTVLSAIGKLQAQVTARLVSANNLSDLPSASTARTNLGLGSMAVQNANAVAITGGTIDNITLDGGSYT